MSITTWTIRNDWHMTRNRLVVTTSNFSIGEIMIDLNTATVTEAIVELNQHLVGDSYYQLNGSDTLMLTTRVPDASGIQQSHRVVVQGAEDEILEFLGAQLALYDASYVQAPAVEPEPVAPEAPKSKK